MALILGIGAALLWGVADFLIRVTGRTLGVHRAMLCAQGFGAVTIAADPAALAGALSAPWPAWAAALVGAPIGPGGTVAIYRAFAVGRVGRVAPIVGAYGAVTAALSLATGGPLGLVGMLGMGAATLGVVPVPLPAGDGCAPASARDLGGLGYALLACLGVGVRFWVQGRYAVPGLGAALPVWIYHLVSSLAIGVAAWVGRTPLHLSWAEVPIVPASGASAVGGCLVLGRRGHRTGRGRHRAEFAAEPGDGWPRGVVPRRAPGRAAGARRRRDRRRPGPHSGGVNGSDGAATSPARCRVRAEEGPAQGLLRRGKGVVSPIRRKMWSPSTI